MCAVLRERAGPLTLDEYIRTLDSAPALLAQANARLLMDAIDDLKTYGQLIGHEQTGRMDASMHSSGPFPVGSGILEAAFESGVPYAEEEVMRGGSHDWATRTVNEQQARIFQLQTEVEQALITALTGGA
jgi:hypothetical protein